MWKYIGIVVAGVLLILIALWLNHIVIGMFSKAGITDIQVMKSSDVIPMVVVITPEDNYYHKPDCIWIGRDPVQIRVDIAEKEDYEPCPYCFKQDSSINELK